MSTDGRFYHCSVKTVSRSAGRSAVGAAAYRLGECLHDDRYDKTHDYTRRGGVVESFTVAPEDAPDWALKPEALWNAAEAAEKRVNSRVAREVELALPALLSPRERRLITETFAGELVERYGVAVTVALHSPGKGDDRNFHAHILFTTREMMPDGLGAKTRILDDKKTGPEEVTKLRQLAADIINKQLAAVNSDIRVDHRSFTERGIEKEPTTHLGPAASAMERRDEKSDRGDINREAGRNIEQLQTKRAEAEALKKDIQEETQRLAEPPTSPEDARERLQGDRHIYAAGMSASAKLEKALPADRMGWSERLLHYVARTAKTLFDGIAQKARDFMGGRDPEPEKPEKGWHEREQARAEKDRGRDL